MSMSGGSRSIDLLTIRILCASSFVLLLLIISTANGTCGSPPNWIPWPTTQPIFLSARGSDPPIITCIATNARGYPVPGTVFQHQVTQPNGTTSNIPSCATASPFHPVTISTTFKVLRYPLASLGDRIVIVAVHNASIGLRSIKDPQCTVSADGGNATLVDPTSGPLYIGLPRGTTSDLPGGYVNGVGVRNGWLSSSWNGSLYVLGLRKILTAQSKIKTNDFACYEGFGATGTLFKTFTVTGSRTNCITACLGNTNCTMVTVAQNASLASSSPPASVKYDYNLLNAKSKLFLRVPIVCQLYRGGIFIGSASANLTVCHKLVD